jgi:murein endopeptidase
LAHRRLDWDHGFLVRWIVSIAIVGLGVLPARDAFARRHIVQRGETLIHIARAYGCTVERIQRANRIDTTLIRIGARLTIPECGKRDRNARVATGSGRVEQRRITRRRRVAPFEIVAGQSIGAPWAGRLRGGVRLPAGDGYLVRRPNRAWGASHVVGHIERAIAAARDRYPDAKTLAIGDLSERDGGEISDHRSHQSGRDVDIGFFFKRQPDGYPESFAAANDDLDLPATWALLQALVRTADEPAGVSAIFVDHDVQRRLYKWALDHDVPRGYLDRIFQYPHGRGADVGLIRHQPNHHDHFHVRFQCPPDDGLCR